MSRGWLGLNGAIRGAFGTVTATDSQSQRSDGWRKGAHRDAHPA
jgi:hypothetical protein